MEQKQPVYRHNYRKLLSNTLTLTVGSIVSKILVFFLVPLYTYCLSTADFGVADLITNTANFLIPCASLGITGAVFRFAADRASDREKVFSSGFCLLVVVSVVFLLLSPVLYLIPFFNGKAWLIVLYVLTANLHAICSQYLRAEGKMRFFAVQGIFNTISVIVLNLLFLLVFKWGIVGYVLSVVISDFVTALLIFFSDGQYRALRLDAIDAKLIRSMLKYSIPLIPATIFWWITNVSDRYLVTAICGESVNGIYSVAYKIPTILTLLSGAFIDAWQLSSVADRRSPRQTADFFTNVYRYFIAIMFPATAVLIPMSKPLSAILFADAYYGAWEYMPFLICSSLFLSLTSFLGSVYIVRKKTVLSFWTSLFGAVVNIVLNIILIPRFGAIGAAFATFISYAASYVLRSFTTKKFLPFCQYPLPIAIGTILLLIETAIVLLEPPLWWLWAILSVIPTIILFFQPFCEGVVRLIRMLKKKKSGKNS